ncbi:MAG: hypothetical protein ACBR50_10140 [Microcoleus sp.]
MRKPQIGLCAISTPAILISTGNQRTPPDKPPPPGSGRRDFSSEVTPCGKTIVF